MTITSLHNGAYEICDILNGYLVRRIYFGYTKSESIEAFKQETRGIES